MMQYKIWFRELRNSDAGQLYKIYSDKDAMKFRGSKVMESIEDGQEFVQNQRMTKGSILTIRLGIELLIESELIGSVMIKIDKNNNTECEIGYSIGRQFWKQGLGTEIVKLLIKYIKDNTAIKHVFAWSHMNNIASIRILERNEFCQVEKNEMQENFLYHRALK